MKNVNAYRRVIYIIKALILLNTAKLVLCQKNITLNLISFTNSKGLKSSGSCCDGASDCFSNPCDLQLYICISNYNSSICDIGDYTTKTYTDENNVVFKDRITFPNIKSNKYDNLNVTFTFNDIDNENDKELIEQFHSVISTSKKDTIKSENLKGKFSSFIYSYKIDCIENYYGVNCERYCINKTQYYCNKNGEKVCHSYWFGTDCNSYCKEQDSDVLGHYTCDKTGNKVCQPYWFGSDCKNYCIPINSQMASYTCDKNGLKVCSKNWYGKNCDKYCQADDKAKFVCEQKTGEKLCFAYWFGKNCDVFCKELPGSKYLCDNSTGYKICSKDYFGINCTKYCHSSSKSNFSCNALGNKVCKKNFHGLDCQFYVPELPKTKSVCSFSRNGLVRTFDHRLYTFHGNCVYQVAADCNDDLFAIHLKMDPFCSFPDCNIYTVIYFGTKEIKLGKEKILVNNNVIKLPYVFEGISVYKFGQYTFAKTPNGVTVYYDNKMNVFVELRPARANKTCGLCGNYNGISADDTINPYNGKLLLGNEMSKVWKRLSIGTSCNFHELENKSFNTVAKDVQEIINSFCQIVYDKAFTKCSNAVNQTSYYKQCLEQLVHCNISTYQTCLCDLLTHYSRQCSSKSINLDWRTDKLCGVSCPNNLVYNECGTSCEKSCQNVFKRSLCRSDCVDGCFCPTNMVKHGGRCIKKEECPCMHNKKSYKSGETMRQDCNTCTCSDGKWKCSHLPCPGKCIAFGDPHFKTFDGKWYDFNGICKYILAKDCLSNQFAVVVENIACDEFRDLSCAKSVMLSLNYTNIILSQHGRVLVDNTLVVLPYASSGVTIRKVSSLFVQVSTLIGVTVLFDGNSRIYLEVSHHFKDKTCGLCGTFNDNQNDDFKTPEDIVESDVISFGNAWKTDPTCKIPKSIVMDPCKVNIQKENIAEKKCEKLKAYPFTKCHDSVDVDEYLHACKYDMCGCIDGIDCLCNAIAAYTKECAENGIIINWRNQNIFPECAITCKNSQVYQECGNICKSKCRDLSLPKSCVPQCVAGCNCPNGTIENDLGECVLESQCPCYHNGNTYYPGHLLFTDKCKKCTCQNGKFECKLEESLCSGVSKCPDGQYWSTSSECTQTCQTLHVPCMNQFSLAGCRCPNKTVWDEKTSRCINANDCPCHYNGRTYKKGEFYHWDCNTCTCMGNHWSCTKNNCHGTCSVYGDPHYTTFDGKKFLFEGRCNYVIAQDACNETLGNFSIQAENVACGSTGSTCTKSVVIQILDTEIILEKDRPVRNRSTTGIDGNSGRFTYIRHFFYDIIHSDIGLTVLWDRETRISINLHPKYKGKTCGLCGNFNDNQNDDFMTPEFDTVVNKEMFGDSWKVDTSCPETTALQHPCTIRKERSKWSQKQCNILNKPLFQPCHAVVDPRPYYDACYFDTCGCDSGGDCNCLCTAVSVYAEACSQHGIYIKWRSQEFCPIQCEKCQEYLPCGPSNPKTCKNMCSTHTELPIKCVEGCFCSNDTVLHNSKCIKPDECPCYMNGVEYKPGTLMILNCQHCLCQDGCFQCKGEKCPTTAKPPSTVQPTTSSASSTSSSTSSSTKKPTDKISTTDKPTDATTKLTTKPTEKVTTTTTSNPQNRTTSPHTTSTSTTSTKKSTIPSVVTNRTTPIIPTTASTTTTTASTTTPKTTSTTTTTASTTTTTKKLSTAATTPSTTSKPVITTQPTTVTNQTVRSTTEATTQKLSTTKTKMQTNATSEPYLSTTKEIQNTTTKTNLVTTKPVLNTTEKSVDTTHGGANITTKPNYVTTQIYSNKTTNIPITTTQFPKTTTQKATNATTLKPTTTTIKSTTVGKNQSILTTSKPTTTTTSSLRNTTITTTIPTVNTTVTTTLGKTASTTVVTNKTKVQSTAQTTKKSTDSSTRKSTKQSTVPSTLETTKKTTTTVTAGPTTPNKTTILSTTKEIDQCIFNGTNRGYKCKNSRFCIPKGDLCDSLVNCPLGDDESDCPTLPPTVSIAPGSTPSFNATTLKPPVVHCDGYLCKDDNKRRYCIKSWYYCDGISDCPFGDDENNKDCKIITESPKTSVTGRIGGETTTTTKITTTKESPSTTEIPTTYSTLPNTTLTTVTEFVCQVSPEKYGCSDKSSCLDSRKVCDSHYDCANGEDESDCPHSCSFCSRHNFKCHKTCQCVPMSFVCDGSKDCDDSSDEIGCKATPPPSTTATTTTTTTQKPLNCTNNKIYKKCVKLCENQCKFLLKDCVEDYRECQPGCTCPDNLVSNGLDCILPSACSCYDEDLQVYFKSNDRWEKNCQVCVCFNDTVKCQPKQCNKPFCPWPNILIKPPGKCCAVCKTGTLPPILTTTPTTKICLDKEFQCKSNGRCIPAEWKCDGERDCYDASDERGCMTLKAMCFEALGVSDPNIIPEHAIKASSYRAPAYRPHNGRLNRVGRYGYSAGAWCPILRNGGPHWIQVDLGNIYFVTKVSLQGRYYVTQFVTYFKLKYSINGYSWIPYTYKGKEKIFEGVHSVHQIKRVKLDEKIRARYVRIVVNSYHRYPCLRFEVFGCLNETIATTTISTTTISTTTSRPVTTPCVGFLCDNGTCIVNQLVCNSIRDCVDGTDEICNKTCSDHQIKCSNGYCLDKRFVCDGDKDCLDGRDELNCKPRTCPPDHFMCRNGKCIMNRHVCDGDQDCLHGDDEVNCPSTVAPSTTSTSTSSSTIPTPCPGFLCKVNNHCLKSLDFVCDGYKDCPSLGEDERCCDKQKNYLCPTKPGNYLGECIGRHTLCDGFADCDGGYDEINCTSTTPKVFTTTQRSTSTLPGSTTKRITTTPGPSKCPRNSTCICEKSCDSIADNPDSCSAFHCTDECECPVGYNLNKRTGFCDKVLDCPCQENGKVYKIGDVIMKGDCMKCMCTDKGFTECANYCPLPGCPEGEEIVYESGQCCKCQKKIVCRNDQIVSPCACSRKCGEMDFHCGSTCKKGCMCSKGTYDNGTNCVLKSDCYCTAGDGSIRKPGSRWKNGTCDICKCDKGVVTCGKTCAYFRCQDGFQLVRPENECCYCRKIDSPTTLPLSTHTTTPSTGKSTKYPLYRCTKFDEKIIYRDKDNCTSFPHVVRSKCSGSCHTSIVMDLFKGITMRDCSCCRPESYQSAVVQLTCPNGSTKRFAYQIINKCECQSCDSSPFHDVPLSAYKQASL